ncbi:ATP-binding protein [Sulfitobacter pseudonitzschiae]|uniref:ATP-binding protein n=1 Tax=Pseudosulfitobacter pseudonitzschiae TaxID=1402135 RepID=A0A9Q2RUT6_9RHOB|nr:MULTISPECIES: ATP-binding protein [Roseobacteraceae]MBM2291491.1 ATP-binding protein [Pseudosulfitobacter pseudonitzschiae]MBM2296409.1 ATP-binding protein [Pseudosulfitobacter pseudonitzschiae]MBM2301322.1 ATP-binding protein [Pseudosulfitobacter pseudonitzschiae]MBM2311106.1 ATP-binding protein [Pseudosulfitobacter pseudonitzschiae]MBM2316019.1 ATP-binding protein [Pseudosulfitobacter pseudonitzschiae]|tara:strand:+ start:8742 stop:10049 length:1308 start_codon:yes stop_codon:yes gene_type:complete
MTMQQTSVMAPPAPKRLEEMKLPIVMMRDILIKTMFRKNLDMITDLAPALCLPVPVVQELIDMGRDQRLIEATGTLNANNGSEMGYQLTDNGKARALDALAQSEYFGAMPVPLDVYREQVERQSIRNIMISREQLTNAMGHLVLPDSLLDHLGPAVSAGRSILMYGPPGNGKSSISNGIRDALGDHVYVPRAIEYAGQVITVYDPIVHVIAPEEAEDPNALRRVTRYDRRYVRCERPTVITGGELSLNMLDLVYNPVARTYQAPLQLKSTGGIFIVDDLGRQAEPPQALVNRWIVPLEESKDILALQSGEKFEVPFDTLVIFSTNFHPNEIFDQAALRRIFFKIKIDGPNQANFLKIFAMVARKKKMALDEPSLVHLLKVKYPTINNIYANYQPVFLIDQMIAICDFEGIPYKMSPQLVDRAWANMFVKDEVIVK